MADKTLTTIQETLAHQERQIQDLSDMLIHTNTEISKLQAQITRLEAKLGEQVEAQTSNVKALSVAQIAARDKPPHY